MSFQYSGTFNIVRQIAAGFFAFALIVGTFAPLADAPRAHAATNLILNPSMETQQSATVPQSWTTDVWGTTVATFTYPTGSAQDGTRYVKTQVTTKGTGDAKWSPASVVATPGQTYIFSDYYQANTASIVEVEYLLTSGAYQYVNLGNLSAATGWTLFQKTFTAPANVKSMTIFHFIQNVGTLSVDNYSLTTSGTAPVTKPVISSFTATPTSIVAGNASTLAWGVTPAGATLSINQGVGTVTGSTSVSVKPIATTIYTLTASNSAGTTTLTRTVTVTKPPLPTISSFTATPTSIVAGTSTRLAWVTSNATTLSINQGVGVVTGTSNKSVSPTTTLTYTLTATNITGTTTATRTVTVTQPAPKPKPTISSFTATPASIALGSTTKLAWVVANASSTSITNVGVVTGTSTIVAPTTTRAYVITATNPSGNTYATTTVTVIQPPAPKPTISSFTATPASIVLGNSSKLAWVVANASSTSITSLGNVTGTSTSVAPTTTKAYVLSATNPSGTTYATTTVTVTVPAPKPTIASFAANPGVIALGQSAQLVWNIVNASTTVIDQGVGSVTGTSTSVSPLQTVTYTITATNPSGSVSASTTLLVTAPPAGSNVVINPSLETENGTLPANWSSLVWGTNNAVFTYDKTSGHTGTHSAKVDITTYTDGDAKWVSLATPVTPGDSYRFSDWYKSTAETYVIVDFTNNDDSHYYLGFRAAAPSATWKQFTEAFSVPYNAKQMVVYHLVRSVGSLTIDDYSLVKITPQEFNRGIVTLTFDDGWEEDVTSVLPVLRDYGFHATMFFATSFLESTPPTGPLNVSGPAAIHAMQTDGHEIGGHSVTHPDLTTLTPANLDYELSHSKTYLESVAGVGQIRNLATPYGSYNDAVIAKAESLYHSLRSTDEGFNSKESFDQYRLMVQNMQSNTTLAEFQSWVNQAKKDKSWLIIVYHRVATSSLEQFDTPEQNFRPQMEVIKNSGLAVLTTEQALQEVLPQLGIVTPPPPPPVGVQPSITSFSVNPISIAAGESATLSWNVLNASTTAIDQGVGIVTGTTKVVTPAQTTTYTLTATNPSGVAVASTTVTVTLAPPPPPPPPQTNNLIQNPTFTATSTLGAGIKPTFWNTGAWGAAAGATFTYPVVGIDDNAAAEVSIASYTGVGTGNGAAEWYFDTVPVTGGTFYTFSDAYKSDATSYMVVQWLLSNGTSVYEPVTTLAPSGGVWKTTSQYFTAPTNATGMTILHQLQSVGTLTVDTFSLTASVPSASESLARAVVTLAFDDGLTTQYENALPILTQANVPGSFYIITDRMNDASAYDYFTDPNQIIGSNITSGGATWSEIYTDPTEQNYRFFDVYTATAPSTIKVSYTLNGAPTVQTIGTLPAGTNARGGFQFTLPTNTNGNTVSPITISHTNAGPISISQPSLIPYSSGYISKRQVLDLQAMGQEVGVHTKTHPDLSSLTQAQATTEIAGARSALQGVGIAPAETLAYPYGNYNFSIEQIAANAGLKAARSVDIGYNSKVTDVFALKTNSVNTPTSFATVKSWIDTAIQNKLWLVLTFHNVDSAANLASIGDPYGTTPEILQQIVSYIAAQQSATNLEVKTMNAALPLVQ